MSTLHSHLTAASPHPYPTRADEYAAHLLADKGWADMRIQDAVELLAAYRINAREIDLFAVIERAREIMGGES